MATEVLSLIGVGFIIMVFISGTMTTHFAAGRLYQLLLLGGISLAMLPFYTHDAAPDAITGIGLFFLYALPSCYFFLIISSIIKTSTRFHFIAFVVILTLAFVQSACFFIFDYQRNTVIDPTATEYVFNRLLATWNFIATLIATMAFIFYVQKNKTVCHNKVPLGSMAHCVMPIIGMTILCLFGSILFASSILPTPMAMHVFSWSFAFTGGYMAYLRFNRDWSDVFNFKLPYSDYQTIPATDFDLVDTPSTEAIKGKEQLFTSNIEANITDNKSLAQEFEHQFIQKKYFLDSSLTIKKIAAEFDMPEYKIRNHIRETLGYTNFKAFVNTHRINYVKQKLSNPQYYKVPVKTIAFESGFDTAETCIRVFKTLENTTPQQYRKNHIIKTTLKKSN